MSIYINTETGEYPRHIGDIHLAAPDFDGDIFNLPEGWAPVVSTEPPAIQEDERYFEVNPTLIDGTYVQTWDVRALTAQEIEHRDNPPKRPWEIAP